MAGNPSKDKLRGTEGQSLQDLMNQSFDHDAFRTLVMQIMGSPDGVNLYSLKVKSDGSIVSVGKATDGYGWQATSEDATYKYLYFEDSSLNYYILRKHKVNKIATYAAGTGGYTTVYTDKDNGPSGSPSWGTFGATF